MAPAHLRRLEDARDGLVAATDERIEAIRAAREACVTWREIAAALGITERGVTKLVRTREAAEARAQETAGA